MTMIYSWYDKERWITEIFRSDPSKAHKVIERLTPLPEAKVYYRKSYASFRVKGLEYARLSPSGQIRWGIPHALLDIAKTSPETVVSALVKMFESLAEQICKPACPWPWVEGLANEELRTFILHVLKHHQAEHWLESEFLSKKDFFGIPDVVIRSQVPVPYRSQESNRLSFKFIDLLVLDEENHEVIIAEIKEPQANQMAVHQVRDLYLEWVRANLHHLLDPTYGYFYPLHDPSRYHVSVAFIAPTFSGNFVKIAKNTFPDVPVRIFKINCSWRQEIQIEEQLHLRGNASSNLDFRCSAHLFSPKVKRLSADKPLAEFIQKISPEFRPWWRGLIAEWQNAGGSVTPGRSGISFQVQHQHRRQPILWGFADERLEILFDKMEQASFTGKEYLVELRRKLLSLFCCTRTLKRIKINVPPHADEESCRQAIALVREWVKKVFKPETPEAWIITHGDIDGMVCAAQLVRREQGHCQIRYSNANWVEQNLAEILTLSPLPPRVYVTDIPANDKAVDRVAALSEKGVEVFWIDHHPCQPQVPDRLRSACSKVIYNPQLNTPAGVLVGGWLESEDPYYRKVGNICYCTRPGKGADWGRNWFLVLSSYIGRSTRDVIDRLAFDQPFTQDDLGRVSNMKKAEEKAQQILESPPQTVQTLQNKTMAVYDTSNERFQLYLGSKVFERHLVDFSLVRIKSQKWQLSINPQRHYDLSCHIGTHRYDDLEIRIDGRPTQLLAIEVASGSNRSNVHSHIVDWLKTRL